MRPTKPRSIWRSLRPPIAITSTIAIAIATLPALTSTAPAAAAPVVNTDTAKIAPKALINQKITWETCTFPNSGAAPEKQAQLLAVPGVVCATIKVPRNWHNPNDGNRITLRISKTLTADPNKSQGYALVNPGGPGGSGLAWGAGMALRAPELAKTYNFVGFDPRGVGESTPAFCTPVSGLGIGVWANEQPNPYADGYFDEREVFHFRAIQKMDTTVGCSRNSYIPFITTEQTSYDMDFIRVLLDQKTISYLGFSYGTWLGAWYASIFPTKVHRMLLDSVTDVSQKSLMPTWDVQPLTRERQFDDEFLPYIARHDDLYHLGTDPMAIRKRIARDGDSRNFYLYFTIGFFVLPAFYKTDEYPAAASSFASFLPAAEIGSPPVNDPEAAVSKALAIGEQLAAEPQNTTGVAKEYFDQVLPSVRAYHAALLQGPAAADDNSGDYAAAFDAIRCNDGNWSHDEDRWWDEYQKQKQLNPIIALGSGDVPMCAAWPAAPTSPPKRPANFPKIIMVQRELDAATDYNGALNGFRNSIPGGTFISVDDEGTHGVFPAHSACVDDPIMTYFNTGKMPKKQYIGCAGTNPLPGETKVYKTAAKLIAEGTINLPVQTARMKEVTAYNAALEAANPGNPTFDWCALACHTVDPSTPRAETTAATSARASAGAKASETEQGGTEGAVAIDLLQRYLPQPVLQLP